MRQVLGTSWALLLGLGLLMVGNGLQGTLLGVRGSIEGFSTFEMSIIMSAYFAGFLGGSRIAPELIRRVGHVRVFAALASFVSAVLILYPLLVHPVAWILGRVLIGFCFSGVYVTAESWLNNSTDNENRGKALSLYIIVQMAGIVFAQYLLVLGDPSGYMLFVVASVAVSISFAPILLSISPTPPFHSTKPMSLLELVKVSPLGCVGTFLMGLIFSAQFGMSAVYGTMAELTVLQISTFVASFYVGALVLQYPIGWISDRMDRRLLILIVAGVAGAASGFAWITQGTFELIVAASFLVGGLSNPLYALLIAYTNDFLDPDDMASAAGGLLFINGVGAIAGPPITGWLMETMGPGGFFAYLMAVLLGLAAYAGYRMTRRPNVTTVDDTAIYAPIMPTSSVVALEVATEYYADATSDDEDETRI